MHWWTVKQLKFKNPQTRRQAVEKLAETRTEEAIDCLMDALQDDDPLVRLAAVKGLALCKDPRTLPSLIQGMRDPKPEVREAVVASLIQIGDETCIEVLVGALKDLHPSVRSRTAQALDALGWKPANDLQKVARLSALGEYQKAASLGSVALDALLAALRDPNCPSRRMVVEALSQIGDER